jgi:hypothetical protein
MLKLRLSDVVGRNRVWGVQKTMFTGRRKKSKHMDVKNDRILICSAVQRSKDFNSNKTFYLSILQEKIVWVKT